MSLRPSRAGAIDVRQSTSVRLRYKERMSVESTFQLTPASGLDGAEAAARLKQFGPNELPRAKRRGVIRILLGVLSEPMFLLLVLAAGIYLAVGGLGEGLLMMTFACLTILLVVVQEKR